MKMKVNFSAKFTLSCITALLLLQGCSSSFNKKYNDSLLHDSSPGLQSLEQQKQQAFTRYSGAFLGKQVAYSAKQQQLLAKPVEFRSEVPMSLDMVLSAIATQTKNSYRINDKVPGAEAAAAGQGDDSNSALHEQSVNFSGTFEEFMRYLSALYDVSVSLGDDNILQVDVYKTYAIRLDYFGANDYQSGLDLSGNSATGGGITGTLESKFQSSFWDDVTAMAQKYISSGVYNFFKDMGVFTFSGRPSEYRILSRILNDYKKDNSKQFVITYKVFTLDKRKTRDLGADLGVNFGKGGTLFNFSRAPFADMKAVSQAGNAGAAILNAAADGAGAAVAGGGTAGSIGFARRFGNMDVSAKLNALYTLTGSKLLQSGTMITRNNTPVPLNLTQSQNYISGKTFTRNGDRGDDTAITTATITTGTSVILTPRILSDGRVQIVSAYTTKTLNNPDVFKSGGDEVQLPNVTTTELFNTVDVTPGSLVVVGQYDEKSDGDERGLGILTGTYNIKENSRTVVMVIGIDYYNKPLEVNQ